MLNQVVLIGGATRKTEKEVFIRIESTEEGQRKLIEVPVILTKEMLDNIKLKNIIAVRGYIAFEDEIKIVSQKIAIISNNVEGEKNEKL